MINNKEAKEKNKGVKAKTGTFIAIFFLLLYVPSLLHWIYGSNIRTEIIRIGTIEQAYNTDAYLIRDEAMLKSPFDGKYIPTVSEGERVPAGFEVATVLKGASEKLLEQLKELDIRIIKDQEQKSENLEIFSEDIEKVEGEIYQRVKTLVNETDLNSLSKTKQIKEEMDRTIQKKALIIGNSSTTDVFLNSLKAEKQKLQEQIKLNTREITTDTAGIISYYVDGYEDRINPGMLRKLNPETLDGLKNAEIQKMNVDNVVETNKPFAKIIKDVEYYAATVIDADHAKLFKIDDAINVRINDTGTLIDGIVHYKSEEQNGKCVIAVKLDKGLNDTVNLRKVNIDLIRNYYKGLKVPLSCMRDIDEKGMTAKITLNKANYAQIREVRIVGKTDEWAVIESLKATGSESVSLYDIYVTNPENVREGQMIDQ